MRQLTGFDAQTKILERRLAAPLAWPEEGLNSRVLLKVVLQARRTA